MKRTALIVLLLLAIAGFAAANWQAFTTPTALTLGFVDFTAPLGLLLLATLALVTFAFSLAAASWQAHVFADSRRQGRELMEQRRLAQEAEASRFTALRTSLAEEVSRLELRIDAAETSLRGELRDGVNSLAAMVGEMDHRLAGDDGRNDGLIDSPRDLPPRGSRH